MAESDSILDIQRGIVALERAKRINEENKNKRDIRARIARSGWYMPENDQAYEYQHYPRNVEVNGKSIVVHNEDEENRVLGKQAAPAKSVEVDVAAAVEQQTAPEQRQKRKYTRKAAVELPANLE